MDSINYFKYYTLFVILTVNILATSSTFIQPTFDKSNENVTVIIGNSAVLPCFINNLGDHKVFIYFDLYFFKIIINKQKEDL
jgi:hypothetical protein